MIEAHIVSARGSLYYSAPTTPYDLENLRSHVRDARAAMPGRARIELRLEHVDGIEPPKLSSLIRELKSSGVIVTVR